MQDKTRHDKARQYKTIQDNPTQYNPRHDKAIQYKTRQDNTM